MRTAGQRGAIAVISAVVLATMCLFCFGAIAVAQYADRLKAMKNSADALAVGNAMAAQMQLVQNQTFPALDTGTIVTGNLDPGDSLAGDSKIADHGDFPAAYGQPTGLYIPGKVRVSVSYPIQGFYQFQGKTLTAHSEAYFNQVQISKFTPKKDWVMLLLDFSPSMKLPITSGGTAAYIVMQQAIATMQTMPAALRQNWGMRIFAGGPAVPPLQGFAMVASTTTLNPSPDVNFDESLMLSQMVAASNVQSPVGDSTDIGSVFDDVVPILQPASSGTNPSYGSAYTILVTDGEPDSYQGDYPASMPYASKIKLASDATSASVNQAWRQGVNTASIQILRDQVAYKNPDDESFLQSISGNAPGGAAPSNFAQADTENKLQTDILNVIGMLLPRCRTSVPLSQMGVPGSLMPGPNDLQFGFLTGVGGSTDEKNVKFCGAMDPANPDQGVITCLTSAGPPIQLDPSGLGFATNEGSAVYAYYYDTANQVFELNDWACQAYLDNVKDNLSGMVAFRVRWGVPYLQCSPALNNCTP